MAPMAEPSEGGSTVHLGMPLSRHEYDLTDAETFNKKGLHSVGANPPPAWSSREFQHNTVQYTVRAYAERIVH